MIEGYNSSKAPVEGEVFDFTKYVGVASVNVIAINPDNAKLRQYGWQIAEGADEPKYVSTFEKDGVQIPTARVRFLVKIKNYTPDNDPVLPLDFHIRQDVVLNREKTKCKVIDSFGRTAWATQDDLKNHKIPLDRNGNPLRISTPYKLCHYGEEELIQFLMKYLVITPFSIFNRVKNEWENTKNPGKLTIDNWDALCKGDTKELAGYLAIKPDNCVTVVLGVRTSDNNRVYQTFLNTKFYSNAMRANLSTGEYDAVNTAISKFCENRSDGDAFLFSAAPVREWKEKASTVEDNSEKSVFDVPDPTYSNDEPDADLPF